MTNPNKTSITIILDKSGSMSSCIQDTIGGYSTFLEEQQKLPGECDISLIQFSNETIFTYKSIDIKDAPKLSLENYRPSGGTALLDAVGKAISEKGKELSELSEDQRPGKVIMVIITDGEENASKAYTYEKIKEMIEHQTQKYNWIFTFLGANLDATSTAASIGIASGSSLDFSSTTKGGSMRAFEAVTNYCYSVRNASSPIAASNTCYSQMDRDLNKTP